MRKAEKLEANGIFPQAANPDAAETRFASAMPKLKNRSGNSLAKARLFVEPIAQDRVSIGTHLEFEGHPDHRLVLEASKLQGSRLGEGDCGL